MGNLVSQKEINVVMVTHMMIMAMVIRTITAMVIHMMIMAMAIHTITITVIHMIMDIVTAVVVSGRSIFESIFVIHSFKLNQIK